MVAIRTMVVAALVVRPTPTLWAQTVGVQIDTAHNTPTEQSESARLQGPLGRFDLTPWVTTIGIAIVAAAIFGVLASIVFSWASNRSAAWNIGFGAALVLATATALLVAVVTAMRRFSP